ncbi:MAG: lipocalin-like domain-containing protein [Acidobacteria bacterium]|nr:lipocalin-like domain-containing protein [Acidobacteriota bacterium]
MNKWVGIGVAASLGIILSTGTAQAPPASKRVSVRSRLVGTWELVSTEDRLTDGSTRNYPETGPHGKGFLIYTADGYMCAQLMNPDRLKWKDENKPTDAEKISAFEGFISYCGKYEVNDSEAAVYHLPETAWVPDFVGTKQKRPFTLRGDVLTFAGKVTNEPGVESYVIVWRKVRASARR